MAVVLGVDSSTQSTKVEARDVDTGEVLATGRAVHPTTQPPVSEQDPREWWRALIEACAQLGEVRDRVVAIAVAGQQHGLVLLDSAGEPVRPAKLWNDTTSAPQAGALVEALDPSRWASSCGSVPVAAFTIAKLAWVAEHEPDKLARARRIMLPHDYLTWRLSGRHTTDRGDASGTGWFDPTTGAVDLELLGAAVPDAGRISEMLPEVVDARTPVGRLSGHAAAALGLPTDTLVGSGTGDNMGAAVGLGLSAGDVVLSLGTSGTAYAMSSTPTSDPSGHVAGFAVDVDHYLPLVCTLNATKVTDTFATLMGTDAAGLADLALAAIPSTTDPVLLPYLDGERTPDLPAATGTLLGLTNGTSRGQLARAAHDGVLCGLFAGVDALTQAGVRTDGRLLLIGGGAKSAAYRQRCADLHGDTVLIPAADETVATGAAILAARLVSDQGPVDLARAWGTARGMTVDPIDADGGRLVRSAHEEALNDIHGAS